MKTQKKMSAIKIVQSQGLGTRKEVVKGIRQGKLWIEGAIVNNPNTLFDPQGVSFAWDRKDYIYCESLLVVMNKKLGEECSHSPDHHPSVYERLTPELIARGVQAIGRLDVDTSGLLLFTDDGQYNHQLCSPKYDKLKVYHMKCEAPLDQTAVDELLAGVELNNEKGIFKAQTAELKSDGSLTMGITEGKYHQVRRMLAAIGHRVTSLHRMSMGEWKCDDLKPGEWKIIYNYLSE